MANGIDDLQWRRRARQSLQALQSAGIDWVARHYQVRTILAETPHMPRDMFEEMPAADGTPALTLQQRKIELTQLAEVVAKCQRCSELCSTRTQTVFGVGPLDVEVCCIGEAPGADEDKQGEPFVGAAGQLLTKILAASGFKREEVYICNILKCRPPGNRTPLPPEAENCREYLNQQLALVRPKYMIAFGATAAQTLLKVTTPIGKMRGQFHNYHGIPVMVTYHPAYLLPHRAPAKKKEVWDDMQMLLKKMGREIPKVEK